MKSTVAVNNGALAFAGEMITGYKDRAVPFLTDVKINPFSKSENRDEVIRVIKQFAAFGPRALLGIVGAAQEGWELADEALREMIAEHLHDNRQMPPPLATYNMELMLNHPRPAKPRGPKKADQFFRDMAILTMVLLVSERYGLRPVGRGVTGGSSACAIVARALRQVGGLVIDYKAVETIWGKYSPSL